MRHKKKTEIFSLLLAAVLLLTVQTTVWGVTVNNGVMGTVQTNAVPGWPQAPDTISETAVLIDADTGAVLYDKGMNEIRYPASITKLMTLLLAVENCSMDEPVTFTGTGLAGMLEGTNIGRKEGEIMTMEACLYAMIICSANEVAKQVAEHVAGSEAAFVELMNQRAQAIGCRNTHFVNASGMPDENHYSTAYDFAKILREGLKNPLFAKIVGTQTYEAAATNMRSAESYHTHLPVLAQESPWYYEGCIGGKTGFTLAALNTVAAAATRNGMTYIAVTMRDTELSFNCADLTALWNYGFDSFEKISVSNGTAVVPKGTKASDLTIEPKEVGGLKAEAYYYSGHYVGKGLVPDPTPTPEPTATPQPAPEEEPTSFAQETEAVGESLTEKEAKPVQGVLASLSELSDLAKLLLAIMAGMMVLLIILIIALVVKERKHK